MMAESVCHLIEKCRVHEPFEGIAVVAEFALHRQAGVLGAVRVLKS
jgi:hypothetical protein